MSEARISSPESMPSLVGSTFHERYEVLRSISTGGMGAVYEAMHLETRRRCALKVMLPSLVRDAEMRARFRLECTVASDVDSEHIVQVLDAGVDAPTGLPFLVRELLKGEDLFDMLERRGTLPPDEVVLFLYQAALALEKTHAAGIVHRDLKPENLFITYRDDGSPRLKILDFGIAKVMARQDNLTTGFMGTPMFMAPEQLTQEADITGRTDTYALGHLAFVMLTGTPYWESENHAELGLYRLATTISKGGPEPATRRALRYGATLPAGMDAWFAKATARDAKERFRRALNLVAALAEVLGVAAPPGLASDEERHPSGVAAKVSLPPRAESSSSTRGLTRTQQVAALALLALAGMAIGGMVLAAREPAAASAPRPPVADPASRASVTTPAFPSNEAPAAAPAAALSASSRTPSADERAAPPLPSGYEVPPPRTTSTPPPKKKKNETSDPLDLR